jgi:hypothetical protein
MWPWTGESGDVDVVLAWLWPGESGDVDVAMDWRIRRRRRHMELALLWQLESGDVGSFNLDWIYRKPPPRGLWKITRPPTDMLWPRE